MKKSILSIAFALGMTGAFAQDLTSKKGEPILPEANDWAISVDATPFLQYAGNFFRGAGTKDSTNLAPSADFLNANRTIIGKMFKDEKTAYRGILRIGMNSNSWNNSVAKDFATAPTFPASAEMVTDKLKLSNNFIGLGAGMEMRRGKTRLQGYYGADAMLWMNMKKASMTYGNAMDASGAANTTATPTSTTWTYNYTAMTASAGAAAANGSRKTSDKAGTVFGFGVRGFIGAEYFIFPKISLGAEFGWGLGISSSGMGTTKTQTTGGTPASVAETEAKTNKSSSFWIDTDQNMFGTGSGALKLNLHF